MPNIQSAKKALRVSDRRRVINDRRRRALKQNVKAVTKAVLIEKNTEKASTLLGNAYQAIDKAMKGGVIKKNNAARKKSRLARLINKATVA
jgi:small subunit ribosomal protein S20